MSEIRSGIYKHRNGHFYQVLFLARHTETNETLVVYAPVYRHPNGGLVPQARPASMWNEIVDGAPRFTYIGQEVPKA